MKYVLNIIILFIFLIIITNNKDNTISVVSLDDNDYQVYDIYTDNLNTNNLDKYFSNTTNFLAIYPKVNKIYQEKLGTIFYKCNRHCNINEFILYYKNILKKNNYYYDVTNIDYYGVNIEKIKIYTNKEELANILKNCTICSVASN